MKQLFLEYLRKKLFAGEYAKLELSRRTVEMKTRPEQIQLLTRTNLASFDHRLVDTSDDILVLKDGEDAEMEFLKTIYELSKNSGFSELMQYIKREQVLFIAKQAQTVDELNFARGTINGLVLLQEETDRLVGVYRERTSQNTEEYDEHEVI